MLAGIPIVLLWVLVGWPLRVVTGESASYLLLGVPITLLFQRFVRKRPMRELWLGSMTEGPVPPVRRRAVLWTLALAAMPLAGAIYAVVREEPGSALYSLVACLGAVPLAFAVRRVPAAAIRPLLHHAALPVGVGLSLLLLAWIAGEPRVDQSPGRALVVLVTSFATYLPALCVVEEPFFRGALDAHATRPHKIDPSGRLRDRWTTAVWVAVLWGIWNLPLLSSRRLFRHDLEDFLAAVAATFVFHAVFGVALSLARRRSGSLLAPLVAHAFVDATRVALGIGI